MITLQSRVQRLADPISTRVGGELVMLDVPRDKYVALNDIGTEIWDLIETPTTVSDVCEQLQQRFHVSAEQAARDVVAFLGELEARALITVVADAR